MMYTTTRRQIEIDSVSMLRWFARSAAIGLFVAWVAFVLTEATRSQFRAPSSDAYYQVAALVAVFAGYAVGCWRELAGGLITLVGLLAFYVVHVSTVGGWPE